MNDFDLSKTIATLSTRSVLAVRDAVLQLHERSGLGHIHGPSHWSRVAQHALFLAKAEGVDPLVPYLFSLVHDSQRENDGEDIEHGRRAQAWVLRERNGLFRFLCNDDLTALADASRDHSYGFTMERKPVMVCWDADRLDLGRDGVCIRPNPRYLCTKTAKQPGVIEQACRLNGFYGDSIHVDSDDDRQPDIEALLRETAPR